jgi:hypothetical protein
MAYRSKTYSLSDEVIEEIEKRAAAMERGSPNKVLVDLLFRPVEEAGASMPEGATGVIENPRGSYSQNEHGEGRALGDGEVAPGEAGHELKYEPVED